MRTLKKRFNLRYDIYSLFNTATLNLSSKRIDKLPKEFFSLINLERVGLEYNDLTTLPEEIKTLPKLKALYLHGNPIKNRNKLLKQFKGYRITF
jgi:Leucine-rich repeat (LRR) protein